MRTLGTRGWFALVLALAAAGCAGAQTQVETSAAVEAVPEPPPEPPAEPLAWLPIDASVIARIDLAAFRETPLAKHLPEPDEAEVQWLELDLVDGVSAALEPHGDQDPSAVGVLTGRFGEGYLEARVAQPGVVKHMHGEHAVYENDGTFWVQPRPEMLVGFSADYQDWVLARYEAGDGVPLQGAELYQALAPAVTFDSAHVAVLLQDQDGSARRALDEAGGAQTSFLTRALAHVSRGAVRIQFGDGLAVDVLAEVDTDAHAQQLHGMLQAYLDRWKNSPLVLLLGLGDLLNAITLQSEGTRVSLSASVTQVQIDAILDRLKPMFEGLFEVPGQGPVAPVAPAAPAAGPQGPVAPAGEESAGE